MRIVEDVLGNKKFNFNFPAGTRQIEIFNQLEGE